MPLLTKSGLFDTVDKVLIVAMFVLLAISLFASSYERKE